MSQEIERHYNGNPVRRSTARQIQAVNESAAIIAAQEQREVFKAQLRITGIYAVAGHAVNEAADLEARIISASQGSPALELTVRTFSDRARRLTERAQEKHGNRP
jgi:hypothetical protein